MNYQVIYTPDDDGWKAIEEARECIREALTAALEVEVVHAEFDEVWV